VIQQYDFVNKLPKNPDVSSQSNEVPQTNTATGGVTTSVDVEQHDTGKDKKDKKKKATKDGNDHC
jgi:hypothetical protein